MARGKIFRHSDTAKKSALFLADGNNAGAVASNQVPALVAHPIGHEDCYRMPQYGADGGKGYPRVTARGFRDGTAWMDLALFIRLPQDVQGHTVLDATRHVQLFGLGEDRTRRSAVAEVDTQQGSVTR